MRALEEKEKMLMEDEQKSAMGEVRLFAVLLFAWCWIKGQFCQLVDDTVRVWGRKRVIYLRFETTATFLNAGVNSLDTFPKLFSKAVLLRVLYLESG